LTTTLVKKQDEAIIVLGMHRSGTSALTGTLRLLGVYLGDDFLPATEHNLKGFWELKKIFNIHEQILGSLNSSWHDIFPLPKQWHVSPLIKPIRTELTQFIQYTFSNKGLWAIKDPRMCTLLPLWFEIFKDLKLNPKFIIISRHPFDVAASLKSRDNFSKSKSYLLWLRNILQAEVLTREHMRVFVTYDQFIADWKLSIRKIWKTLDIKSSFNIDKNIIEVERFIAPDLRHYQTRKSKKNLSDDELTPFVVEVWNSLKNVKKDGKDESFIKHFDFFRSAFDSYFNFLGPFLNEVIKDKNKAKTELISEIDKLAIEIKKTRKNHEDQKRREAELLKANEVLRKEIDRARDNIDTLTTENRQARKNHEDQKRRETETLKANEALAKEIDRARVNNDTLTAEIKQARKTHEDQKRREIEVRKANEVLAKEIDQARLNIDTLAAEIKQARKNYQIQKRREDEALKANKVLEKEIGEARDKIDILSVEIEQERQITDNLSQREKELILYIDELELDRTQLQDLKKRFSFRLFFLKNKRRKKVSRANFIIDSPKPNQIVDPSFLIEGWCFIRGKSQIKNIRVRAEEKIYPGEYGIERKDVSVAHPRFANSLKSGFSISVTLPEGKHICIVEVEAENGKWYELKKLKLKVSIEGLIANIDSPSGIERSGKIYFFGWCLHPTHRIIELSLILNKQIFGCNYGLLREDVAVVYPEASGSNESGFEVTAFVPPGWGKVRLKASLDNGDIVEYKSPNRLWVRPKPFKIFIRRRVQAFAVSLQSFNSQRTEAGKYPKLREWPQLIRDSYGVYRQARLVQDENVFPEGFLLPEFRNPYDAWIDVNKWGDRAKETLEKRLKHRQANLPKISVIMPVYNPEMQYLEKAVLSVKNQVYENWELCIADDASTDYRVKPFLNRLVNGDKRIKVFFRKENGNISLATNSAVQRADGKFLVFLDQDDELSSDALAEIALYISEHPKTDYIYSDEDKIDANGRRFMPQFKPDWSPELLLSYMYMGHIKVVRRKLYEKIGGMRKGFEGSQDYDMVLRATESAKHIGHIPLVLYHWRAHYGSIALSGAAKPSSLEAGRMAVEEAFRRRNIQGEVIHPDWAVKGNLGIYSHEFPNDGPSVTIIIPTRNQKEILKRALDSIAQTTYCNYTVMVVDNETDEPEALEYLASLPHKIIRTAASGDSFNFSAVNNAAVHQSDSEYILFLNNDTEVMDPAWLSRMVGYAQMKNVGAVGARLLFPDGKIQHAGIVHGYHHGMAGHAFKLLPNSNNGYLDYSKVARNYSAVTAACMLTPKKLFIKYDGFDAINFGLVYNDVDYCYRLMDLGYRCVYCPGAELLHHEGYTRKNIDNPADQAAFRKKYINRKDPYYSPYLSLSSELFEIIPRKLVRMEGKPIKTLMSSFNLNFEGAPYCQLEMTLHLKRNGILNPIVSSPVDGPLREEYEKNDIPVHIGNHPMDEGFKWKNYQKGMKSYVEFIKRLEVDLVYGNTLQTFFSIDAANRLGLPSIWNPRESEPWQTYFDNFGDAIAKRALECFQYPYRVVFVADATRDGCRELNTSHNFTVIHDGLDLNWLETFARIWNRESARHCLKIQERELVLLLLGTVCERKGQHDLLLALEKIGIESANRIRCFIVGDRPSDYSTELHNIAKRLPSHWQERINIVSEAKDTALYYRAADMFICTSRVESYPRVILEAMAYGLPIVTTPVFGIREQVQEGINGIFYEAEDILALSQSIQLLVEDEELRTRFSKNAKHVLDKINDFDDMIQQYANVFQEAAQSK